MTVQRDLFAEECQHPVVTSHFEGPTYCAVCKTPMYEDDEVGETP